MNTVWVQIAEDIVQLHHFVDHHNLYGLIEGSIDVPWRHHGMLFPFGSLHAYTYNEQDDYLKGWLSAGYRSDVAGSSTLSVRLDLSDAEEEEKSQFEQLQQLLNQLQSIKGCTRTLSGWWKGEWKFDTLLITFKDIGALWRQTKRKKRENLSH